MKNTLDYRSKTNEEWRILPHFRRHKRRYKLGAIIAIAALVVASLIVIEFRRWQRSLRDISVAQATAELRGLIDLDASRAELWNAAMKLRGEDQPEFRWYVLHLSAERFDTVRTAMLNGWTKPPNQWHQPIELWNVYEAPPWWDLRSLDDDAEAVAFTNAAPRGFHYHVAFSKQRGLIYILGVRF
jgi:hypothetical protein